MQHERANNILQGQTNLGRKVFAAVPMQEFWTIGQISNEMNRVEKHSVSKGEITGCLRTLVDSGLVSESGMLTFRSNVKPPKPAVPQEKPMQPKVKAEAAQPSLMEKFFDVATSLRTAAEKIETLAMEMDTAMKDAGKGDEKFKQMQATLRSLMGEQNG